MGALAYTMGRDVVFDRGHYSPGTTEGRRLLAHELVHVVQQGASRPSAAGPDSPRLRTAPRIAKQAKACRPKLESFKAKKHTVGAREVGGRCELMLGEVGVANGISFEARLDVPEGCTGTLEYVQRVDMCRSIVQDDGKAIHKATGGTWIDKNDPVDSMQVQTSGSVTFKTDDSPGQPLAGKSVFVRDDFEMWLAWTPDKVGSKRVALAMIEWSWTGKADLADAAASDCGARRKVTKAKATVGKSVKKKKMPSLGTKIAQTDAAIEPGSCK